MFQAVDRYTTAGKLVNQLDQARLYELMFTRDNSNSAANKATAIVGQTKTLAQQFEDNNTDKDNQQNIDALVAEVTSYDAVFQDFVEQRGLIT